jgi:hypothetical protein
MFTPSNGKIITNFNGTTNKGLDFDGKIGDPINSAADGKVIFSGNSLRSYGNLIIIKHNNSFMTIYAHNSKNLVKEGESVTRGQKIAEMGNTESDRIKLHFELRKDSQPIDPLPLLAKNSNFVSTTHSILNSYNESSSMRPPSAPNITYETINIPQLPEFLTKRIALVIGNSAYKSHPLDNPKNDADDISKALRGSGFQVIDVRDASLAQMRSSVRDFGDRLLKNDVGLVYYSGHGIESRGRNYLIPVNADIKRSDEIADQSLDMGLILEKMETAKKGVNILIVDACRDDPFGRGFRSGSRGLSSMDAPQGTIVAFATSPGKVAADGQGRNSPYTKNLVKVIQQPNLPIEQVFKIVRREVQRETKGEQTPWENTSLSGDFYFNLKK